MCRESLTQRVNPLGPVTFLSIREQLSGKSSRYFLSLYVVSHFTARHVDRLSALAANGYDQFVLMGSLQHGAYSLSGSM